MSVVMVAKSMTYAMVAESLLASAAYFLSKDWKHGVYWAAAATLTAVVTVMK